MKMYRHARGPARSPRRSLFPGRLGALCAGGVLACLAIVFTARLVLADAPGAADAVTPLAADEDSIRIGALYDVTGHSRFDNAAAVQGAQCAAQWVNRRGGVLGRPLELILLDTRGQPLGAAVAVERAAAAGVTGLVGPLWSSQALAAAKKAQTLQIPMVAAMATHPHVTRAGDFIFRVCYTDTRQGRVLGKLARSLGHDRVAILRDLSSDYSMELARSFKQAWRDFGGEPPVTFDYKRGDADYTDLIDALLDEAPSLVFIPGHDESATLIAQARKAGLRDAHFLGGDGWDSEYFRVRMEEDTPTSHYTTHWRPVAGDPMTQRFREACPEFQEDASAALSFDAVTLVVNALERAGATDPHALRRALADTTAFQGVTGEITMDAHGDPSKAVLVIAIEHGEHRLHAVVPAE